MMVRGSSIGLSVLRVPACCGLGMFPLFQELREKVELRPSFEFALMLHHDTADC